MPAPGAGTRTVSVGAARLPGWVTRFAERHGAVDAVPAGGGVRLTAQDGATAELAAPYGPWSGPLQEEPAAAPAIPVGLAAPAPPALDVVSALAEHVLLPRRVAVLLVRRGGYAAAVVDSGRVVASKVGSRYVQGRTAAGGWSQQRFARRREQQAGALSSAAAEVAVRVLLHTPPQWLATGGDRPLVDRVLADPRLAALRALPRTGHLAVADPGAALVATLPDLLTRVSVVVRDPG